MFYNDFTAAKSAGLVTVEADKGSVLHRRKRFDPATGEPVADEVTSATVAELRSQRAGLLARIAEIDALLADIDKAAPEIAAK